MDTPLPRPFGCDAAWECVPITVSLCQRRQSRVCVCVTFGCRNEYLDHIRRYREAHPDDARPFGEWPEFERWCGRSIPQGGALRKRLTEAHYAIGSGGNEMSRHEAAVRAMQGFSTTLPNETGIGDECISSDHTFATAAAFNIAGKNKVWNLVTGWLIPLVCLLVKSTSTIDLLHAAECLAHRRNFAPKVHFTDTWPVDEGLWYTLMPFTLGRLDIFHFMKRISSTLRATHERYGAALFALSCCIFQYNEDDIANVKRALRDGTLNGKKHSNADIDELVKSGLFWKRYRNYVARVTFSAPTILENLNTWAESYPLLVDSATGDTQGHT